MQLYSTLRLRQISWTRDNTTPLKATWPLAFSSLTQLVCSLHASARHKYHRKKMTQLQGFLQSSTGRLWYAWDKEHFPSLAFFCHTPLPAPTTLTGVHLQASSQHSQAPLSPPPCPQASTILLLMLGTSLLASEFLILISKYILYAIIEMGICFTFCMLFFP